MHCFGLASRQVWHRRNIGCCVCGGGKEDDENQCDVLLIMHRALNSLVGIKKIGYEFNMGPEIGHFLQCIILHTPNVV